MKNILIIILSILFLLSCISQRGQSDELDIEYSKALNEVLSYLKTTSWENESEKIYVYNKIKLDTLDCITYGIANFNFYRNCLNKHSSSDEICNNGNEFFSSVFLKRGSSFKLLIDENYFETPISITNNKSDQRIYTFTPLLKSKVDKYRIMSKIESPGHGGSEGIEFFLSLESGEFYVDGHIYHENCSPYSTDRDYLKEYN